MIVYIVVQQSSGIIESVWSTKALAKAAILYHSFNSNLDKSAYNVVDREVNTAKK